MNPSFHQSVCPLFLYFFIVNVANLKNLQKLPFITLNPLKLKNLRILITKLEHIYAGV